MHSMLMAAIDLPAENISKAGIAGIAALLE
jgi:hypothetical protein